MIFYAEAVEYGQTSIYNMRKRIGCNINRIVVTVIEK